MTHVWNLNVPCNLHLIVIKANSFILLDEIYWIVT